MPAVTPTPVATSGSQRAQPDWAQYFSAPVETATEILLTGKANGEAGHFAVMRIPQATASSGKVPAGDSSEYLLIAGSKNVHLAFSCIKDIDAVQAEGSSRLMVAAPVARAWLQHLDMLARMEPLPGHVLPTVKATAGDGAAEVAACLSRGSDQVFPSRREQFLWALCELRLTVCIEFLQPGSLHVERFPIGAEPEICLITMVPTTDGDPESPFRVDGLDRGVSPAVGAAIGKAFCIRHVGCESVAASAVPQVVRDTRAMDGLEGRVLYFLAPSSEEKEKASLSSSSGEDGPGPRSGGGGGDADGHHVSRESAVLI